MKKVAPAAAANQVSKSCPAKSAVWKVSSGYEVSAGTISAAIWMLVGTLRKLTTTYPPPAGKAGVVTR